MARQNSALPVATLCFGFVFATSRVLQAASPEFSKDIQPILKDYCFACHAAGANEGSMSFDDWLQTETSDQKYGHWFKVLKQLQLGAMPPATEVQPTDEERQKLIEWIKYQELAIDPQAVDPGKVTIRRLNRVEYRNSVKDLIGVQYDTNENFPADDTGHGFDNIGEVLSISPLLFEKYVDAAKEIVDSTVPKVAGVVREVSIPGSEFAVTVEKPNQQVEASGPTARRAPVDEGTLSYYYPGKASAEFTIDTESDYIVRLRMKASETYVDNQFDDNKCRFSFIIDDEEVFQRDFGRQGGVSFTFEFPRKLANGKHLVQAQVEPLSSEPQIRNLRFQIEAVDIVGPMDPQHYVKPQGYDKFFPGIVPEDEVQRHAYTEQLLRDFASRAFRRPVDDDSLTRLLALSDQMQRDGATYEVGISKAMTAVLASPQFLFREEFPEPSDATFPLIDEYSLASRLSYFLWSTMPDEELLALAAKKELRNQLNQQIDRMLQDERSSQFFENFVGQWLRARVVETIQISGQAVLEREKLTAERKKTAAKQRFFDLFRRGTLRSEAENAEFRQVQAMFSGGRGDQPDLDADVREAMRRESEMVFEYIVKNDRSLLELLDSDYTFLNQKLAKHYDIVTPEPVAGDEMRFVSLPADSPRGGILTQGTMLVVTSNPDRTSPVKRGLFILENLLGSPPPAPPPNVPSLDDVPPDPNKPRTLRESLALHRENALCSSCHNRMDPLGLALENFNAMGRFRTEDLGTDIDASGALESGERFTSIDELKQALVSNHYQNFYRCLVEKLMTYALGRSVEYHDAHTVDMLVSDLIQSSGKPSVLIKGIINSPAFQQMRQQPE